MKTSWTKLRPSVRQASVACAFALALGLTAVPSAGAGGGYADDYDGGASDRAYDDDRAYRTERRVEVHEHDESYVFATTRMVNDWDVHPAMKVPLLPVAVVIDIVFLPAEVIADAVR